jgi:hypothetical protein
MRLVVEVRRSDEQQPGFPGFCDQFLQDRDRLLACRLGRLDLDEGRHLRKPEIGQIAAPIEAETFGLVLPLDFRRIKKYCPA